MATCFNCPEMKSSQPKVLAAIVTFNGAKTIEETLQALMNQTRKPNAFLIVDNASDDNTVDIVRQMEISNLKINVRDKNKGVAIAYNLAVKQAVDGNYDWLWLFDQDSVCQPDCLEKLLSDAENIRSKGIIPSVLFPTHYLKSTPGFLLPPWKWNGREMVDATKPDNPAENHTPIDISMTSGALYNVSRIKSEEGFREDFFIDFVDHEYHKRLSDHGHKLFWIHNAAIHHSLGKSTSSSNGQTAIYHDPWRYSYIGRNMFVCYWKWGGWPAVYKL
jgi:rhamnosyltransferase